MPNFDHWVQRYIRRVNGGEFLHEAAEWLAGFCFLFGVVVLLVKLHWTHAWPHVIWIATGAVPVAGLAWWWSRPRRISPRDAIALLDQKLEAGGLLMTLSELPDHSWSDKLPHLESRWRRSLPALRPTRFAKVLVLPIIFAVATCAVPLRTFDESFVQGAVAHQQMQRIEELMQQLEEADVLKKGESESQQLRDELEKLADETKQQPLTHEKWETVDALEERLKAKLDQSTNMFLHAAESLEALREAINDLSKPGQMNLSDEQFEQLESEVAQAMQQLAKSGQLGKLPPELRKKLSSMSKSGQFKLPQDTAEREALANELQEFLDQESLRLAELRDKQNGPG